MSSVLEKEALGLFDNGLQVFLSDPATKKAIGRHSEYDPVLDREYLLQMCIENPDANLAVAVQQDEGVAVLGVSVGSWPENGEESFKGLCQKYGEPKTLAFSMPTGVKYYFFMLDCLPPKLERESGLRWDMGTNAYPVYPSTVEGKPIEKIGTAASIQSLSAWLSGSARAEETNQNKVAEANKVATEATAERHVSAEELANLQHMGLLDDSPEKSPSADTNHLDTLRKEITSWGAAGSDKAQVLARAIQWNRDNGTPVKTEEVVGLVDELGETDTVAVESLAGEDLLFKLAEQTILFHDGLNDPYFHFEGVPFKAPSKDYEGIIQHRYYARKRQMPKATQLKNVMNILRSKARHEGPQIILKNRVSDKDGAIIYDLCDKRYLTVSKNGWGITPAFPLFYHHKHQQPQLQPVAGGDPWKVFDFLPVEEENRLLIMVYLISLFVPRIAHPVLAVFGDQGSAKSCFCTIINKLVDPTLTEKVILPRNERDLIQTLRQKYVTVLDNLSRINDRVSDIFCQVCTGASISYRTLYTDEGENIAQFRHVIILNSINLAIANADLMDRSIILKCHRIKPEDRRPEDELWAAFEVARPGILGGIFDTLVKAMVIYPTLKIDKLPRLADFAKWGYAIAEALGQSGQRFIEDFSQNIKRQNESVVEKNVLCQTVLQFMSDKDAVVKTVKEAHAAFQNIAGADARDETFPKLPHLLRGGLEQLRTTLAEHNITFQYLEQRTSSGVKVLFSRTDAPGSQAQAAENVPEIQDAGVQSVPDEADEPEVKLPTVEFETIPEVING